MKIRSKWLTVGALASALTVAAFAQAGFKKDGDSGSVKFHAVGPAGLNIDGDAKLVVAQQEGDNFVFKADLNSLKTGIGLRDTHCKKAVNAGKHQYAILTVPISKVDVPEPGQAKKGSAKGEFKLNGKTKDITFNYMAKASGKGYAVQGTFTLTYTDFIEKQCYLKQCVDEKVEVTARVKMKKD